MESVCKVIWQFQMCIKLSLLSSVIISILDIGQTPIIECRKEYSLSALKKSFAGAVIDEDLFQLMKDDASRSVIENILIKTYLSSEYPTHSSANVVLSTLAIFS